MAPQTFLARPIAPEDIRPGAYIAVLKVTIEVIPQNCVDAARRGPCALKRFSMLPWDQAGPLKVKGVCLPFVLVKTPSGDVQTLDVRRLQLARLPKRYARAAYEMLGKPTDTMSLC